MIRKKTYCVIEVLWRVKEAMSDGVSSQQRGWFSIIKENVEKIISDSEFKEESIKITNNTKNKGSLCILGKYLWQSILECVIPKWLDNFFGVEKKCSFSLNINFLLIKTKICR